MWLLRKLNTLLKDLKNAYNGDYNNITESLSPELQRSFNKYEDASKSLRESIDRMHRTGVGSSDYIAGEWYAYDKVLNFLNTIDMEGMTVKDLRKTVYKGVLEMKPTYINNADICFYCGEATNPLAGNPGLWPLFFPQPDGTGTVRCYHVNCVIHRLK